MSYESFKCWVFSLASNSGSFVVVSKDDSTHTYCADFPDGTRLTVNPDSGKTRLDFGKKVIC